MLIRRALDLRYSDITPKQTYLDRRSFLAAGSAALGALALPFSARATTKLDNVAKSPLSTTEKPNTRDDVTHYNNYYEFGTAKEQPADLAKNFKTSPWTLKVGGEVAKPKTLDLDSLYKIAPLEERIYRHRCVEAWSIVVPWIGVSLSELLKQVQPTPKAKYVAFESYYDLKTEPAARYAGIPLPYTEGLRLDEAMHPLTMLTVGMYGETLPPQDGAPIRLTVPWKYGFKSIKSLIKITLVEKQPTTTWQSSVPNEYGFYANVNPQVDHPRWSQASERRLGEFRKRPTLMFNGYGDQVASLYNGMDLRRNY